MTPNCGCHTPINKMGNAFSLTKRRKSRFLIRYTEEGMILTLLTQVKKYFITKSQVKVTHSRRYILLPILIFEKPLTLISGFVEAKGTDVSEKELTVLQIVWDAFHCYAMTWQGSSLFLFTRQSINRCTLDLAAMLCVSYVHTQSLHDPIPIGLNPKALQGLWTVHYKLFD